MRAGLPLLQGLLAVASTLLWASGPARGACLQPPGDVNGDGQASVVDVQCNVLANLWSLSGQTDPPPACLTGGLSPSALADHNCDTVINVTDTQLSVFFALGIPLSAAVDANANQCVDACESDLDGDGVFDVQDCAPHDPHVYPGAPEVCNGHDDDCSGAADDAGQAVLDASCSDGDACNGVEACPAPVAAPAGVWISELHAAPAAAPGAEGQWVELTNTTAALVNLRGWRLDGVAGSVIIDPGGALFLPPGGRVVLAGSLDLATNGSVRASFAWPTFSLALSDQLFLRNAQGLVVDQALWTEAQLDLGRSLARVDFAVSGAQPAAWSSSSLVYGAGDRGTPGGPNRDATPALCLEGAPVVCEASGACETASCESDTGTCVVQTAPNGAPCDDSNVCTGGDFCLAGICQGILLANCCGNGFCEPGEGCACADCEGAVCDDGNVCTSSDVCQVGNCAGLPVPGCCGNGFCEPGELCGCAADCVGAPCTNLAECLTGGACSVNGLCAGGAPLGNCCGNGICEAGELCACVADCEGLPCDDGDPSTSGESCQADGGCGGGAGGCTDGIQNGSETGVDCGGPSCPPCSGGQQCASHTDCESGVCKWGLCAVKAACLPLGYGSTGRLGTLTITGSATLNTTTGVLTSGGVTIPGSAEGVELLGQPSANPAAPQLRVYHFQSFSIPAGASLKVTGSHAVAILAVDALNISGVFDASGTGGNAGSSNVPGTAGAAGPGGTAGGAFQVGPGCTATNGKAAGPGSGQTGPCGGTGSSGSGGSGGAGGGGGGGGCGGGGGAGGGHATAGGSSQAGGVGTGGNNGTTFSGTTRTGGSSCFGSTGTATGGPTYGQNALPVLYGGTGGSAGGFGGLGGSGGTVTCSFGTSFGGLLSQSGGGGGGGGGGGAVLLCAGGSVSVAASGVVNVQGGFGGFSGFPDTANNGGSAPNPTGACGGGGGGGRSGRGGSAGGGAGGSVRIAAPQVALSGTLNAGGGSGGSSTLTLTGGGGFGGNGKNGGTAGGQGGTNGGGGSGGAGGLGYLRVESQSLLDSSIKTGVFTSGPLPP